MTIDSADDSKISNRTINTNRISNRTYDSKSNRITKLRCSLNDNLMCSCYGGQKERRQQLKTRRRWMDIQTTDNDRRYLWITVLTTIHPGTCVYYSRFRCACRHLRLLADLTNGRAYATVLRLSSLSVVCNVKYCG